MNKDLFSIVFVSLMLIYLRMSAKDKCHDQINAFFLRDEISLTSSQNENNENLLKFVIDKKSKFLFEITNVEGSWLPIKVFVMALLFMICLFLFSFMSNLFRNSQEVSNKTSGDVIQHDIPSNSDLISNSSAQKIIEVSEFTNATIDTNSNTNTNTNTNETGGYYFDDQGQIKWKNVFLNKDPYKKYYNKITREGVFEENDVYDVIYTFAMDLKMGVLLLLTIYIILNTYAKFILPNDDNLDEVSMHMHCEIMMFIVLLLIMGGIFLSVQWKNDNKMI
jgi:hypothetical protein